MCRRTGCIGRSLLRPETQVEGRRDAREYREREERDQEVPAEIRAEDAGPHLLSRLAPADRTGNGRGVGIGPYQEGRAESSWPFHVRHLDRKLRPQRRSSTTRRNEFDEQVDVDRLREVMVEARGPGPLAVVLLAVARDRDEDAPAAALVRPQLGGDLVAAQPRQADVEEQDLGPERVRDLDGRVPVVGDLDLVARRA